ncbi:MAG: LysM peptidoglycan-binding domain-containing protein [Nitrospira sp.]|nr:LysM peptidoglycan-binding domain-containing protein [Nitrospira sp.]MCA9467601.1 LysM peptidoglycan-binding domain-containing protein [Nitrospira sp.]MCB9711134.1 LysM peptidoglycan-binding domain-containing protein [Nitrospiraceae bacterium]
MTQSVDQGLQGIPHRAGLFPYVKAAVSCLMVGGLLAGCVSSEKFEQEKARALNFQRLLAQEEKRTGELNVKYQDTQRQVASLENQSRDLNAELEALREQLNRSHDELSRVRDGGGAKSDDLKLSEPSISEFGLGDLDFKDSDLAKLDSDLNLDGGTPLDSGLESRGDGQGSYHTVEKGETLYRISKQYGVSVQDIKSWNNLPDNTIHVGQKLMISHQ